MEAEGSGVRLNNGLGGSALTRKNSHGGDYTTDSREKAQNQDGEQEKHNSLEFPSELTHATSRNSHRRTGDLSHSTITRRNTTTLAVSVEVTPIEDTVSISLRQLPFY
jgi:hypothetical protein